MAKKKTPPAKKQFIAIDTYADLVISKGSLEDVTQVLESYIQDEGYGEDEFIFRKEESSTDSKPESWKIF